MLIHLEKLGKSFGEKVVLHDVSASVEKEDRIGIVGQNGAGKTTLLKILTGVYTDYDGEFSVTHGVTLGYLEQNAKLDVTLDIYGEMRSSFAPVLDAMARMQILEKKMAASPDDAALLETHDELQSIIDAADGYNMDVNIKKVLSGMGFAQDTWSKNVGVLSGGELTRLRLAKLLLEKPDVLILDEPTNHLDFATMEWLENYLKGYSGAVLVVSHDRYFLDNVCTKIWEVSFQTMTTYKGNFSAYLPQKEAADALRQKQHDADVALAEKLQDYIDRNGARAATAGMANSRKKMLDRIEVMAKPLTVRDCSFSFPYEELNTKDMLVVKSLKVGYDSQLIPDIDLHLNSRSKVWIRGTNGVGKTTLVKTLLRKIPALGGSFIFHPAAKIGYIEQDLHFDNPNLTAYGVYLDAYPRSSQKEVRAALAKVGLTGELAIKPVSNLSGGEMMRLKLAIAGNVSSNILILDEPTNHLDIKAKKALKDALTEYEGALLLVTHEPDFADGLCDCIFDAKTK